MAIELSRMDFHVTRFLNSEDVEDMTAEEIGQYCLLLFQAWTQAKEASLPDDPAKLGKYARVSKVSPVVLKKFPRVDTPWGRRRRNDVQYSIWLEAKARSECGRIAAAKRWQSEGSKARISGGNAISDHTIPEQAEQNIPEQGAALKTFEELADKWSEDVDQEKSS